MSSGDNEWATPGVAGMPRLILRFEGLALLSAAAFGYHSQHGNWVLFAVLFLAPDLSMVGYLVSPLFGAICYNVAHTTLLFGMLAGIGYLTNHDVITQIGLIGLAHVGFDRAAGYGLKYPEGFGFTHLGRIGKEAN